MFARHAFHFNAFSRHVELCMKHMPTSKNFFSFLICWLVGTPWVWGQSENTAKLIEAAKREKEVVIYGTMDLRGANLLNDKFREKYPFVDVKLNRFGSGNLVPRTIAEVRAGKYLSDILQTNSLGLHFLKKQGLLGHYLSPEDRFYPTQFKDQGYWTTTNMNVHVLAYNTRLLMSEKLPTTYEDLLIPVWRGKMVLDASEQWFALMLQIMGKEKGLRYMATLAKQNILLRRESSAMRAQLIAAGEAPLDIDSTLDPVDQLKKRGAPIDWFTVGAVPVVTSAHGVASRPLHPNAARLYIDFILSKEGQRIVMNDIGRQVARSDLLSEQESIKNLRLIPLDPASGENMDYYARQIKETFQQ
jgi:iron(III) transport system substrate-binding protein